MFSIQVTDRSTGKVRIFQGSTAAQAWSAAMRSVESPLHVAALALLDQLADARPMLEECNESGRTAAAFRALETAARS